MADPIGWLADVINRTIGAPTPYPISTDPYDDPTYWPRAADSQPAAEES